jgi:hypothetical protein
VRGCALTRKFLATLCSLHSGEGPVPGGTLPRLDRGRPSSLERKDGTEVKSSACASLPGSTAQRLPSKKTVCMGRQGEAAGFIHDRRLCYLSNTHLAVHFDLDQRARVRSCGGIIMTVAPLSQKGAAVLQSVTKATRSLVAFFCRRQAMRTHKRVR